MGKRRARGRKVNLSLLFGVYEVRLTAVLQTFRYRRMFEKNLVKSAAHLYARVASPAFSTPAADSAARSGDGYSSRAMMIRITA